MRTQPIQGGGSSALPAGYRLGEYLIAATLGEGGFGITYRARDTKLGVDVAIKEYFPTVYADRTQSSTIVPRPGADQANYEWGLHEFLKEAQVLAKFKHPHIVRVLRFLEANGTAYTIMEYEEGETLSGYLKRHGGVVDEPKLLRIFLPVLNGLQAVHDAGLLHLDIKPDNIYLRTNEQPMLIDFGSSRQMRGDSGGKITLTPCYAALEQYPGHGEVGATADVYGMGATLYRCITGKNPVDSLEREKTFARTRIDPLAPATSFERPIYSPHVRQCIDRALKLAASERPASIYALQQGLMGKDMDKIAARTPVPSFRPGAGFIGVVLPAEQKKKTRRRISFTEVFVALIILAVTSAVVVPRLMLSTGQWTEEEVYEWLDNAKADTVEQAHDLRDWINLNLFGVAPRPKVASAPPTVRRVKLEPEEPPAPPPKVPFGADKPREPDINVGYATQTIGFLKHGAILAVAGEDGVVRLWDVATGTERLALATKVLGPGALGIYPSSQWVAVMNHARAVAIFDPLGNLEGTLVNDPPHPVHAIGVSTNGRLLAEAAEDGSIGIWELSQKRRLHALAAGKYPVQLLAFSPDERLLIAADTTGGLATWDATDGRLLSYRQAHAKQVVALAFSPDGKLLASSDNTGDLRISSVPAPGEEWSAGRVIADMPTSISAIAFSPDNEWLLVAGGEDGLLVLDVATGTSAHRLTTDRHRLRSLTVTRDGKWIAAVGDDHIVRIWK